MNELGIGVPPLRRSRLRLSALTERLRMLVNDPAMCERAARLGAEIRARPRPDNLSRLLVVRPGASFPVLPVGRRISIAPPAITR